MFQIETAVLSPTGEFLTEELKTVLKAAGPLAREAVPAVTCFAILYRFFSFPTS
jgi:hypothetical protein